MDSIVFYDAKTQTVICNGEWTVLYATTIKQHIEKITLSKHDEIVIDGQSISKMDIAGAWLLLEWKHQLEHKDIKIHLQEFAPEYLTLLQLVDDKIKDLKPLKLEKKASWLNNLGKSVVALHNEFLLYLNFIGDLSLEALRLIKQPERMRWNALANIIYKTGYQGLPIIGLLSFMIGVVITYQMGLQLRNYGANVYIVDLLGLSVLREFGPLITAIIVAGRTGSAFTAQLGIMKMNQEIDALDTMGVTPAELLLLPRMLGLFIVLPLLTMWADIFGVIGGMVLSSNMLNITWYDFLERFPNVIPLRALLIGLGKAPVFALLIASIGCFQGMQVTGSAESVGKNTTRSVVLAIFFIIIADACFSVLFSKLKL